MTQHTGNLLLSVEADELFLPVATSFVENAASCFGLDASDALRLTLAAEEVFMYLCRNVTRTGSPLQIACSGGGYYAQAVFSLQGETFDLRAFNVTASISLEDDAALDSMGLVIASRSVDRFLLDREKGGELRLALIKEKSYAPPPPDVEPAAAAPVSKTILRPPAPEELKFISRLAVTYHDAGDLSDILLHPGKLADMMAAGEYHCLAALGGAGEIGGAVFWRSLGANMVECFGPYLFNQPPASPLSEELLDGCISAVARTGALGIINIGPPREFPKRRFELLGSFDACGRPVQAWFRMLGEDSGATAWVHPALDAFVRREYKRLVLPREIRSERPLGEAVPPHSVLGAEFDRPRGRVTLRPMWPGADAGENLAQHLLLMKAENIPDILFAVDLGHAWQAVFVPELLASGFEPRLVLPYAGKGDVVFFQYGGERP